MGTPVRKGVRKGRISQKEIRRLKALFLEGLKKTAGVQQPVVEQLGLSRVTIAAWKRDDLEFNAAVEQIQEIALDVVETQLFKNIMSGDTTSIIFYLKTKGRKRGYIEKIDAYVENKNRIDLSDITDSERHALEEIGRKVLKGE